MSPGGSTGSAVSAYDRLHPTVQRWIFDRGWERLRDFQEEAIPAILDGSRDIIIAAATAGGKTEAAFLPLFTELADSPPGSVRVLYLSPLRALINDQYRRLEELALAVDLPLSRRHSDVTAAERNRLFTRPEGVLMTTPESLEALFVSRAPYLLKAFGGLAAVVIDELHTYPGTERGRQVQSLLHRLDLVLAKAAGRPLRRIGLSATLGDMRSAAAFLRPGAPDDVQVIVSREAGRELLLQVRGYEIATDEPGHPPTPESVFQDDAIADDLFRMLRGKDNLVFPNSRHQVEKLADLLATRCQKKGLPREFFPHHGSLSRDLREELEERLRFNSEQPEMARPTTIICTSTLELGIDIGSVATVAQVGPPPSVACLRQRLGRSGRGAEQPSILRVFIEEREVTVHTPPQDLLRGALFQSVAMVELALQRWYEPPQTTILHLSTLVQQTLSLMAQHGGITARDGYGILCKTGPFHTVEADTYMELLRCLGEHDLIAQEPSGLLLPTETGEALMGRYDFYAAFDTVEEYRVVYASRSLGTVPMRVLIVPEMKLIFAGRRWLVLDVDPEQQVIRVEPAGGGEAPMFHGARPDLHERVRREMYALYTGETVPHYLDRHGQRLFRQGRKHFRTLGLHRFPLLDYGGNTLVFPWAGDRVVNTVLLALRHAGLKVSRDGLAIDVEDVKPPKVARLLQRFAREGLPEEEELALLVRTTRTEKWDWVLSPELLARDYASRRLDIDGAMRFLRRI